MIRSEQDLVKPDGRAQHIEHRISPRQRRVPIEAAESLGGRASYLAARDYIHLIDDAEAAGKIRNRAASVREEVLDARGAREAVAVMHLCDGAGRVGGKVDERVGQAKL